MRRATRSCRPEMHCRRRLRYLHALLQARDSSHTPLGSVSESFAQRDASGIRTRGAPTVKVVLVISTEPTIARSRMIAAQLDVIFFFFFNDPPPPELSPLPPPDPFPI